MFCLFTHLSLSLCIICIFIYVRDTKEKHSRRVMYGIDNGGYKSTIEHVDPLFLGCHWVGSDCH